MNTIYIYYIHYIYYIYIHYIYIICLTCFNIYIHTVQVSFFPVQFPSWLSHVQLDCWRFEVGSDHKTLPDGDKNTVKNTMVFQIESTNGLAVKNFVVSLI